jgi:hypothetical protein
MISASQQGSHRYWFATWVSLSTRSIVAIQVNSPEWVVEVPRLKIYRDARIRRFPWHWYLGRAKRSRNQGWDWLEIVLEPYPKRHIGCCAAGFLICPQQLGAFRVEEHSESLVELHLPKSHAFRVH